MVLWFSGTGNSEYIAKCISAELGQETLSIFSKIKNEDYSDINSAEPMIFVTPTYAWRIPRVVSDFMKNVTFVGNKKAYFVMTCGGDIGNAEKHIKKLCNNLNLEYMGVKAIVMPENYIAMFSAPEEEQAKEIVSKAPPIINSIVQYIKAGEKLKPNKVGLVDNLKSGIVNNIFYGAYVKDKKFYTTQSCIGCGKCVSLCPMNNIVLEDNKPVWNGNCTHCMSCICKCPQQAIEYGSNSLGQPRYTCPQ